jgi:hypothetical protein
LESGIFFLLSSSNGADRRAEPSRVLELFQ